MYQTVNDGASESTFRSLLAALSFNQLIQSVAVSNVPSSVRNAGAFV